jgi:hypothetical protein
LLKRGIAFTAANFLPSIVALMQMCFVCFVQHLYILFLLLRYFGVVNVFEAMSGAVVS